jgi:hypothetical protein
MKSHLIVTRNIKYNLRILHIQLERFDEFILRTYYCLKKELIILICNSSAYD